MKQLRNLNDLAKQAKVTSATVSMALRNSPLVSVSVRDRIQQLAKDFGFTPRAYMHHAAGPRAPKRESAPGPVLLVENDLESPPGTAPEIDTTAEGLLPTLFQKLNEYHVNYTTVPNSVLAEHPEMLRECKVLLYYNRLQKIALPPTLPAVQIFGWTPLRPAEDRITANDDQVTTIAAEFFQQAGAKRALITWQKDKLDVPWHPRLLGFLTKMNALGIPVTQLDYTRGQANYNDLLKHWLEDGDPNVALFAFSSFTGLRLCAALDALGRLQDLAPRNLLVSDRCQLLNAFSPVPHQIDLDFPMMATRAVQLLLWRLQNPTAPTAILLQTPKLY